MMFNLTRNQILIVSLILVGALTRVLPHAPNFTAIGAIALFGGVMLKNRWVSLLVPMIALLLSDLVVNNLIYPQYFSGFTVFYGGFWAIYGAFALIVLMGRTTLKSGKLMNMAGNGIVAAILFFLITNFQVWATGALYPKDLSGLLASYIAGLPFLGNMVLATTLYLYLIHFVYQYLSAPETASKQA
jgi:hypothetical protein